MLRWILVAAVIAASAWAVMRGPAVQALPLANVGDHAGQHLRAVYSPLHFKPAIASATDAQCLACHREVLEDRVRAVSPAGVKAADSRSPPTRASRTLSIAATSSRRWRSS
jgi:hypothetical protein